jgi:2-succinyl-5-enolpyruvyl-6-hydroxy-3-cyclohexene-1-carboxylate synthase
MINYNNLNTFTSSIIIEELLRNGINFFCISPGSRSTPLAVAVASNPNAKSQIFHDERAAAFFALGYARARRVPAVLICTSGSAVANYLPAIVEADADDIPLIALTADRPPELQDCGASQTINQENVFSTFVRWSVTIPPPELSIPPESVLTSVDFAIYNSKYNSSGPVHINCQFREPLAPIKKPFPASHFQNITEWIDSEEQFTRYSQPHLCIDSSEFKWICKILERESRGLVVVGRLPVYYDKDSITKFLDNLGWPVFADVQSGINSKNNINLYDQILISDIPDESQPQTILYLGEQIVSKRLLDFIGEKKYSNMIRVKESSERHDPTHGITHHIQMEISSFCRQLDSIMIAKKNNEFLNRWRQYSISCKNIVQTFFEFNNPNNEAAIAQTLTESMSSKHAMYLGNSMPVRYIDMFGKLQADCQVGVNRGVSGIDGLIASALGFAYGLNKPITILSGDLSILHDLNSLARIRDFDQQVIVVVINNNGGGIFSLLPIAKHPEVFDPYFTAPHDLTFVHMAKAFSMKYYNSENFTDQYKLAVESGESALIEVITDRLENAKALEQLRIMIKNGLKKQYD